MPGYHENQTCTVKELIKSFETMGFDGSRCDLEQYAFNIPRIIIDDFDSSKDPKDQKTVQNSTGTTPRVYTRSYSDASIKKILEEAEHRKHEFWKLLDEHNAVIENLKRIENLEHKII
ncbi:uncharacterized protein LOC109542331 [Dendroctonus ponderosae]|uniref:uncharacterized protein LOC109542331 n=1 Tax=Dendroctonus ponderosae TaxID=77166 RepID=UPI0020355EEE|nr:uncharacterized protein LOC109542331 [Dendroctonus ponderosae]